MSYLLDTNILVRLADTNDPSHQITADTIEKLRVRGDDLYLTSQNLIEFRAVATRPLSVNGLGLSSADADYQAAEFEGIFRLLEDTPRIYDEWKTIVQAGGVIGKQVHDARLVAVCQVYSITHLLTFNGSHFSRLAALMQPSPLIVVDPANI